MRAPTSRRPLLWAAGLSTLAAIGVVFSLGTFSAFSSTTSNTGNTFSAGTVAIGDNDAGAALYSLADQLPGATVTRCIKVTYTGSLDADVKLYTPSTIGSLGPFLNLTVTPGTQATPTFPACAGFTPDAGGAIFTGTLAAFAAAHPTYGAGLADYPGAGTEWATDDAVVYRFEVTLADDNAANGAAGGALTTGTHAFTWEARNQ
jgi:hypothetical protein